MSCHCGNAKRNVDYIYSDLCNLCITDRISFTDDDNLRHMPHPIKTYRGQGRIEVGAIDAAAIGPFLK